MNTVRRFSWGQWLMLLVAIACVGVTAALGTWQLRRADLKEQLAAQVAQRSQLPALENTALNASNFIAATHDENTWLQRRASVQGRWLHEHSVFLDNRPMQVAGSQRVGFYVATPLAVEGSNRVIWVQRGWIARDFQDRSKLPAIAQPTELVSVQGRLIASVSKAYEMTTGMTNVASASTGPSLIWQNIPLVDFGGKALLPMALLQTAPEAEKEMLLRPTRETALLRDWPAADTGVTKHYGYAFQWFALCALIVVLYVWFQFIAPRRRSKRSL